MKGKEQIIKLINHCTLTISSRYKPSGKESNMKTIKLNEFQSQLLIKILENRMRGYFFLLTHKDRYPSKGVEKKYDEMKKIVEELKSSVRKEIAIERLPDHYSLNGEVKW
jgi:hypothetical protein